MGLLRRAAQGATRLALVWAPRPTRRGATPARPVTSSRDAQGSAGAGDCEALGHDDGQW